VLHLWVSQQVAGMSTLDDTLVGEGANTHLHLLGTRVLSSGAVMPSYQVPAVDQRS
jgi:hypothetical protein